ncbi:MAG: hypothetical protein K1000chlam1_00964 [Candidatus Anoxychlamydiales bacterium]|nr:hypothetical protein [Candidatus Anoxychlamydiales bacterium]
MGMKVSKDQENMAIVAILIGSVPVGFASGFVASLTTSKVDGWGKVAIASLGGLAGIVGSSLFGIIGARFLVAKDAIVLPILVMSAGGALGGLFVTKV